MRATGGGLLREGGAMVALALLAFSLACRLTTDPAFASLASSSAIERLLGEGRRALGDDFAEQADRYFHRGVGHARREARMGFFQRLAREVQPRHPEHLSGGEIREIMPWLRFATRMDPHNVDAYLGAAFWVAEQEGAHRQEALDILSEAQRKNPYDYRVPLQRGMILLKGGDLSGAARSFDFALAEQGRTEGVEEKQKEIDREALLNYRGFLYEIEGRTADALRCYREILRARPDSSVRNTVRAIEEGLRAPADVRLALRQIMTRKITPDEYCHHHDEDEEEGHGD